MPFTIPVLLVSYYPVVGDQMDLAVTWDVGGTLHERRAHVGATTEAVIRALEDGSRYRGYRDANTPPELSYQIAGAIEYLEPVPVTHKRGSDESWVDYVAIMKRIEIDRWITSKGVKEVWLWGYYGGVEGWESNMAGPWGDISNSDCNLDDLVVLDRTYTVYHYNYARGPAEAVEDHMHQIESILGFVDPELFWERFVGTPGEGRCGWSHCPPNTDKDYDWANPTLIDTDIEDWRPDGTGRRVSTSCDRWGGTALGWFIYWMQNLPGPGNDLTDRGEPLSNWWEFIGHFDNAMERGLGLVEERPVSSAT